MPRSRTIKPAFFHNEDVIELPMATRLLFIGLWTVADREGRLEDRPKRLKMQLFPADDVDIDACLDELVDAGMIERYQVDGGRFIQVTNFVAHQQPHPKETDSVIPDPSGALSRPSREKRVPTPTDQPASNRPATGQQPADSGPATLTPYVLTPHTPSLSTSPPTPSAREAPPSAVLAAVIPDDITRFTEEFRELDPELDATWFRQALAEAEFECDGGAGELSADDLREALTVAIEIVDIAFRNDNEKYPIKVPTRFAASKVVWAIESRLNDVRERRHRPPVPPPRRGPVVRNTIPTAGATARSYPP